jgi:hypothetical protein
MYNEADNIIISTSLYIKNNTEHYVYQKIPNQKTDIFTIFIFELCFFTNNKTHMIDKRAKIFCTLNRPLRLSLICSQKYYRFDTYKLINFPSISVLCHLLLWIYKTIN